MPPLSEREREILALFAAGLNHPQVAQKLWISQNTVYTHTMAIRRYFGVHTTFEAVEKARLWDMVEEQ